MKPDFGKKDTFSASFGFEDVGVTVTSWPDRKKPTLCVRNGNEYEIVAHFLDSSRAATFISMLEYLTDRVKR